MADTVLAAQMYTVREFTKTPADIAASLKKVKALGYDAMQVSAFGEVDTQELKNLADGEGLDICATHTGYERMRDETQAVIDEHLTLECNYPAIGGLPQEYREGGGDGFGRGDGQDVFRRGEDGRGGEVGHCQCAPAKSPKLDWKKVRWLVMEEWSRRFWSAVLNFSMEGQPCANAGDWCHCATVAP